MTKVEKVVMAVLILIIAGMVIFWKDIRSNFGNTNETVVDDEFRNEKKSRDKDDDKKDRKDKKGKEDEKDVSYSNAVLYYVNCTPLTF